MFIQCLGGHDFAVNNLIPILAYPGIDYVYVYCNRIGVCDVFQKRIW